MKLQQQIFGKLPDGEIAYLFTLSNNKGMQVKLTNYGGTITSIHQPNKEGILGEILLGYDDLTPYLTNEFYLGNTIGRCANRIANGQFELDGTTYQLSQNQLSNHLHGGTLGFHKQLWNIAALEEHKDCVQVLLQSYSLDGTEGYPGNLLTTVGFKLTNDNELIVTFEATTQKATIVNMTHHCYFNLKDGGQSTIDNHELFINANAYTPFNELGIPTGEILPVIDTPYDFTQIRNICSKGSLKRDFDNNFVLNKNKGDEAAAVLFEESSGRKVSIFASQPGLQFYTGKWITENVEGRKSGEYFQPFTGLCLEPQFFPNSPNQDDFPSTILRPAEKYQHFIRFQFTNTI